jgi:peroxiredoxin
MPLLVCFCGLLTTFSLLSTQVNVSGNLGDEERSPARGGTVPTLAPEAAASTSASTSTSTKAVFYVFLAEGCPICEQSTPELKRLSGLFSSRGIEFRAVFPNRFTTDSSMREFTTTFGLPFALVLDTAQTLTRKLSASVTPEAVVVLPSGEVVYRGRIDNLFEGIGKRRLSANKHDAERALEAVLRGELPSPRTTKAVGCVIERD